MGTPITSFMMIAARQTRFCGARDIDRIDVADVLSIYLEDCGPRMADQPKLERCIGRLNDYWGGKMLSQVTAAECRAYVKERGKTGGARADLETLARRDQSSCQGEPALRSRSGHAAAKRTAAGPVAHASEAAKLIWACWRYREQQTVHRGRQKGQLIATDKRPLRHLSPIHSDWPVHRYPGRRDRFGFAVPTRRPLVRRPDQGIFYRLAIGRRATNKRQTPAPIPPRLLAHMRRWVRRGIVTSHFVEWQGAPVKSVKTGFKHAVELAGLWGKVTPHTLRHTAATWLMQRGVPIWQAAGYLGMSAEMLERTYGHHHPDYMRAAAHAITSKQQQNVSLVVSLVEPENGPAKRQKS